MGSSRQPRAWKRSIDDFLKELGFNKFVSEYKVSVKKDTSK